MERFDDRSHGVPFSDLRNSIIDLQNRLWDELDARHFLAFEPSHEAFYSNPRRGWERVIAKFPVVADDVEEASRCYALGRNPACVFHLMRVTEACVQALGR